MLTTRRQICVQSVCFFLDIDAAQQQQYTVQYVVLLGQLDIRKLKTCICIRNEFKDINNLLTLINED